MILDIASPPQPFGRRALHLAANVVRKHHFTVLPPVTKMDREVLKLPAYLFLRIYQFINSIRSTFSLSLFLILVR
jgi:hypothetical protein